MSANDDVPLEENRLSPPDDTNCVADRLVFYFAHGILYAFAIALVGLVGALVMGLFEHGIRQWGWVAGALLAAVGYPVGWVAFPAFKLDNILKPKKATVPRQPRQALGPLAGCVAGIVIGAIVGLLVGFVIVIVWLSLTLSPLTPNTWREGIETSFFFVNIPPWPALGILGWTAGAFVLLGIVLGLCGKIERG
jgi:hypothetical protein